MTCEARIPLSIPPRDPRPGAGGRPATDLDAASTGIPAVQGENEPLNLPVIAAVAAGVVVLGLIFIAALMYL